MLFLCLKTGGKIKKTIKKVLTVFGNRGNYEITVKFKWRFPGGMNMEYETISCADCPYWAECELLNKCKFDS